MNENVFRRVEEKYLLTEEQKNRFFAKIKAYIEPDVYYESKILNIYFDNENRDVIVHSMEKPTFKEKIRLRSYGVPTLEDDVFLEIKDKVNNIVGKRRIKIKLKDFYQYYEKGMMENHQIMKEIDYYFHFFHLKPVYFVSYDRLSYRGIENPHLRITIDQNLRSRSHDLRLELGDEGTPYFEEKTYIMEIKVLDAMPLWLTKTLADYQIYPTSFSKVGSIYKKRKEEEVC